MSVVNSLYSLDVLRGLLRKAYYTYIKLEEAYLSNILSPDKEVLGGIFKNMKYPAYASSGSGMLVKFLGSYEDELNPVLNELLKRNYTQLIDVGCAEGYYAVGLALKIPALQVYAYDIDETARTSCKNMAELNGVGNRIEIRERCDAQALINFPFQGKALVICDCEGFEAELFNKQVAQALSKHDVLIELHDNVVPDIRRRMTDCFAATHQLQFVESKLKSAKDYPLMTKLPAAYRQDKYLLERGTRMEWLIATSRA